MLDALHKQFGEFNFSLEATVSYNWYQTPTTYSSLIVSVRTKLLHNQNISQLLYLLQSAPSSRLDCQILQPQQYRYFPARSYSTRGSRHCRKDIYILHASGEGEKIDRLLREWKDIGCLAEDGSTDVHSLLSLSFTVRLKIITAIPGNGNC